MDMNVTIIDDKSYIEVDNISIKDNEYVYLVNKEDDNDFLLRKLVARDGEVYYDGLKDKEEFDIAMMYFIKKHENMLDEEVEDE